MAKTEKTDIVNDNAGDQMVPLSVVEKLIEEVEALKKANKGLSADDLERILASQREASDDSTRQSMKALTNALIRENQTHPGISAFSYPEGDVARPKPILSDATGNPRETFFCDVRQNEDSLTPAEIEAFNQIRTDCSTRNDTWWARIFKNGMREVVRIMVPCKDLDARMQLPKSLTAILFELQNGTKPLDIDSLARQLADMKDQLAKYQGQKK
ncbi:MAG: hypothetical protein ACOYD0_11905 [Candidatus Nanopelagicales bacterium]